MSARAHFHAWCSWGLEEGIGFPGTRITGSCEPPRECYELNPGPLQDQQNTPNY